MIDLSDCSGCRDDHYNAHDRDGGCAGSRCWQAPQAKLARRFRQPWHMQGDAPGAFTEVEVPTCFHAPGRFAFVDSPPDFAVDVRRMASV